jgi:stress-induced morphogen
MQRARDDAPRPPRPAGRDPDRGAAPLCGEPPAGRNRLAGHGYDDAVSTTSPTATLQTLLERAFPDAQELSVVDRTGGGDHFQVSVASARFDGLSLVDQHRLVYDALAEPLADGTIHELRIKTRGTP